MVSDRVKIHVIGKDDWALGTEHQLACQYLGTFSDIVDTPEEADFLHTVDVEDTVGRIYRGEFTPKAPVVGAINNHPTRLVEWPGFIQTANRFMYLVPQSTLAAQDMKRLGLPFPAVSRIATDSDSYYPINFKPAKLKEERRKLGIPENVYLIGLLQRDSEGRDLTVPKRQKGPDNFLALMMLLKSQCGNRKFHVLLGGPRRHWIRSALEREGIPFTFVGSHIEGEDYPRNILDKETMCHLYNLIDLYVIPTRWEGAPRQVFDVLECGRKIISTPVGIAPDILPPECIYKTLKQGVELILRDMNSGYLEQFVNASQKVVQEYHSIASVGREWEKVYQCIQENSFNLPQTTHKKKTISPVGKNTLVNVGTKSISFLLNRTRLGRLQRNVFPKNLGVLVWDRSNRKLLEQIDQNLRKLGVRLCFDEAHHDTLIVWGIPELTNIERIRQLEKNKRVLFVLDAASFNRLILKDSIDVAVLSFLENADTTILTSDTHLARLKELAVNLPNPVVLRFPPDPRLFYLNRSTSPNMDTPRCLVLIDTDDEYEEWIAALQMKDWNSFTVKDVLSDWVKKEDNERASSLQQHEFAIVLSKRLDDTKVCELLACGLPCLYPTHLTEITSLVGMAGYGVDVVSSLTDGVEAMQEHYKCYASAITLPSIEELALTLANITLTRANKPGNEKPRFNYRSHRGSRKNPYSMDE